MLLREAAAAFEADHADAEFIPGDSLEDRSQRVGAMTQSRSIRLLEDVQGREIAGGSGVRYRRPQAPSEGRGTLVEAVSNRFRAAEIQEGAEDIRRASGESQ